jgi:hypothetical protein
LIDEKLHAFVIAASHYLPFPDEFQFKPISPSEGNYFECPYCQESFFGEERSYERESDGKNYDGSCVLAILSSTIPTTLDYTAYSDLYGLFTNEPALWKNLLACYENNFEVTKVKFLF